MTEEAWMDPVEGVVLGVRWGDDEAACASALGPLTGSGERRRGRPIELAEARWTPELVFELDALCAVTLRSATGAEVFDGPALSRAVSLVGAWLGVAPRRTDEGLWQAEAGATRISLDLVDGLLRFEDMDL